MEEHGGSHTPKPEESSVSVISSDLLDVPGAESGTCHHLAPVRLWVSATCNSAHGTRDETDQPQ